MRVVGGIYRSRLLEWPDDVKHIRPTKDRIREAIFNAVGDLTNCVALDLYAGSGAMGIEALSRNAKKCYFVDINPVAIKTTKKNIDNLHINNAELLGISDIQALDKLAKDNVKLDIVFIDPPYKEGKYQEVMDLLISHNLLNENAIIVFEADRDIIIDESCYEKRRDYKYGEIKVAILWR